MGFGIVGLLVLFFVGAAVLGPRYGADTRDGRDWQPTAGRTTAKRGTVGAFARRQVRMWEAVLTAQQPWRGSEPLRWREQDGAWVLVGDTAPQLPPPRVGFDRDRDTARGADRGTDTAADDLPRPIGS